MMLTFDRPCCHLQEEIYLNRVAELDTITSQRDTQRKYYDDLRKQRLNEFMAGFAIITSKLKGTLGMLNHDILTWNLIVDWRQFRRFLAKLSD